MEAYKFRQPECGSPQIILNKSDIPNSNIHLLSEGQKIYRGMSIKEFTSGCFGQSWTTDKAIAENFAFNVYFDDPPGIVVSTKLRLSNVIHYSDDHPEFEVIVVYRSISPAEAIKE